MAKTDQTPAAGAKPEPAAGNATAAYLDMPPERRAAAEATVVMLVATAQRVADGLPLQADVDDFRRVLVEGA